MCSLWILAPVGCIIHFHSASEKRGFVLVGCEARTSGEIILVPLAEFS